MARKPSTWAPLAAVLLALQVYAGAPPADRKGGPELAPVHEEERGLARSDGEARLKPLAANHGASRADDIKVHSARTADGKAIRVAVALALPVPHDVVWGVLNDYENMPHFVPDILAARVISAGPDRKRVEIEGMARFLFLEFPIYTTLDAVYHPDGSVALDSVAGNLAIHGMVRVKGEGAFTRVDYQARIAPDFWLPPLIGDFLIGRQIRRQFEGMVAEMHRRADSRKMRGWIDQGSAASAGWGN